MTKLAWAIAWAAGGLFWLHEAWGSYWGTANYWAVALGLAIVAVRFFRLAFHDFSHWLFAGEERVEMLECDCSVADKCPQGKVGQQGKCSIWKTIE